MVGIVIVSHSAGLARGVAELAREMGGPDVAIEVAGGTTMPDVPLGTDAALVTAAIEAADSPGGVLVLMDLGSAVLSAELALEMLDADVAGRVLLCEAPLVEGAVGAATAARLGLSLAEVAAEARRGLDGKRQHLGMADEQPVAPGAAPPPMASGPTDEVRITVGIPLGLHARPAARFVATTGRFDADVAVTNLTTGRGPASGRSVNALATLGARQGHELLVRASGPEAADALVALVALADDRFGDGPVPPPAAPAAAVALAVEGATFTGLPASPGIALGPARHLLPVVPEVPTGPPVDPAEDWAALQRARDEVRADLLAERASVAMAASEQEAAILDVHLLYIDDEALIAPARAGVLRGGRNAAEAWRDAIGSIAALYRGLDEPYQRARAADVVDVGNRVLLRLLGHGRARARLDGPGILVAGEATPGDLASLDPTMVTGLATAAGGPLDHAAILARALGIPAVVGLGPELLGVSEGAPLVLDGDAGAVYVDPPPEVSTALASRRAESDRRQHAALVVALAPAVTRDGRRILVEANAGSAHEAAAIVASGADGVGLLRTEFLFLDRDTAPDEEEQYRAYLELAAGLGGRPLVVRTLDAGADKPVPWLPGGQQPEANPALGLRGLRLGLARPEVLLTQLRAVLRVAAAHPVRVMFPMVTTVDEVRRAKALVHQAGDGRAVDIEVGAMVEVPAAALAARHLAEEVDFFSIGTNDLTQYVLAADRGNRLVASLADGLDPSVLGLVGAVAQAGAARGRGVAVCGAMAADPLAVPVLVGLGVTELSVPVAAVPTVKQAVRDVDDAQAAAQADAVLGLESAAAVRQYLIDRGRDGISDRAF